MTLLLGLPRVITELKVWGLDLENFSLLQHADTSRDSSITMIYSRKFRFTSQRSSQCLPKVTLAYMCPRWHVQQPPRANKIRQSHIQLINHQGPKRVKFSCWFSPDWILEIGSITAPNPQPVQLHLLWWFR